MEPEQWRAFVNNDKQLLENMSEMEIQRQEIIYELIQTEKHHCSTLAIMKKVYANGLLNPTAIPSYWPSCCSNSTVNSELIASNVASATLNNRLSSVSSSSSTTAATATLIANQNYCEQHPSSTQQQSHHRTCTNCNTSNNQEQQQSATNNNNNLASHQQYLSVSIMPDCGHTVSNIQGDIQVNTRANKSAAATTSAAVAGEEAPYKQHHRQQAAVCPFVTSPPVDVQRLFPCLDDLIAIHEDLLSRLRERFTQSKLSSQSHQTKKNRHSSHQTNNNQQQQSVSQSTHEHQPPDSNNGGTHRSMNHQSSSSSVVVVDEIGDILLQQFQINADYVSSRSPGASTTAAASNSAGCRDEPASIRLRSNCSTANDVDNEIDVDADVDCSADNSTNTRTNAQRASHSEHQFADNHDKCDAAKTISATNIDHQTQIDPTSSEQIDRDNSSSDAADSAHANECHEQQQRQQQQPQQLRCIAPQTRTSSQHGHEKHEENDGDHEYDDMDNTTTPTSSSSSSKATHQTPVNSTSSLVDNELLNGHKLRNVYSQFCSRHMDAIAYYKHLMRTDKKFKSFIEVSCRSFYRLHNSVDLSLYL
ncbi:hypothetical protein GZH46_00135, partial [Fragariocoptes setiger]